IGSCPRCIAKVVRVLLSATSCKKADGANSKDRESRRLRYGHCLTGFESRSELRSILGGQFRWRNIIGGLVVQRAQNRGVAAIEQAVKVEIAFGPGVTCGHAVVEQSAEDGRIVGTALAIEVGIAIEGIANQDVVVTDGLP